MAKQTSNSESKSNNIRKYFPVVQEKPEIELPAKKKTPVDFYEKMLTDQFLQITQENCSENENELISILEEEESFEKENCHDEECKNEKIALRDDVVRLDVELHKVKKMLRTALQVNLQKDLKLQHMENKLTANGIKIDSNDFVAGDFDRFVKIFTEKELSSLRGLPISQSSDSSFLRSILNYLYKDNLAMLSEKTVIGRSADSVSISPEKLVIMQTIFNERIDGLGLDEDANEKRKKRFNAVVSKIIGKIRTKKKLF